jgi:hypothetical protein
MINFGGEAHFKAVHESIQDSLPFYQISKFLKQRG